MEEMMQRTFESDVPRIVSPNEPHMALLFLLDTSGSMGDAPIGAETPIESLNAGLNQFKSQVCEDSHTKEVLDVALVEFNSDHRVIQEFTPVEYMEPVQLTANGATYMGPAIETAIEMINNQSRFYRSAGTEPYKPWIIMISDGMPMDQDLSGAISEIQDMEEKGKLKFFSLGVGEYDSKTLHMLSGPKVMKLKGYDFTEFFDWANKSMRSVSVSSPGETPKGVPLPESVDKDTDEWME